MRANTAIGDDPVVIKTDTTSTPLPTPPSPTAATWNTSKLGLRLASDAAAAASAGVLVAPVITIIDKGIMENASGRAALGDSLRGSLRDMLRRPGAFIGSKPFALIFTLYFGTYLTANTIDTLASTRAHTPYTSTTSGASKFVATSSSNLALCLYKDSQFTRLFGASGPKRPVPMSTFTLFTLRDALTIFASFNLPPLLAPRISASLSDGAQSFASAASIAQFVAPAAIQIISTPLHLLGLDLYNRPGASIWGETGRAAQVVRNWGISTLARVGRIVPAFGVGGVVNMKVRQGLMGRLEGEGVGKR